MPPRDMNNQKLEGHLFSTTHRWRPSVWLCPAEIQAKPSDQASLCSPRAPIWPLPDHLSCQPSCCPWPPPLASADILSLRTKHAHGLSTSPDHPALGSPSAPSNEASGCSMSLEVGDKSLLTPFGIFSSIEKIISKGSLLRQMLSF